MRRGRRCDGWRMCGFVPRGQPALKASLISHLSSHHDVSSKFSFDTVFPPCTKSVLYLMTHSSYIFSRGLYLIKLVVYGECIPLKPVTPTDCTEVHPDCDDNRIPPILTTIAKTHIDSLCVPCLVHVPCRLFSQRLVCWYPVEMEYGNW